MTFTEMLEAEIVKLEAQLALTKKVAAEDVVRLQADINKRASKALAILSSNKVIMDEGAVADIDHGPRSQLGHVLLELA